MQSTRLLKSGGIVARISGLIAVVVLVAGCNVGGLFTSMEDAPVFKDPDAGKKVAEGGVAAGGPGKAVYGRICASCHLGNGKGVPGNNIPPLMASAMATGESHMPIRIVLHGLKGPIVRNGVSINGQMAAWKDQLSDQEIADVLTYVRSSFGNAAPAVAAADVTAAREKTASRVAPFTESELTQPY